MFVMRDRLCFIDSFDRKDLVGKILIIMLCFKKKIKRIINFYLIICYLYIFSVIY